MTAAAAVLALALTARAEPSPRLADRIIAVALFAKAPMVSFKPTGSFRAVDQASGELKTLVSGREYKVEAEAGKDGRARLVFGPHLFKGAARLLPGTDGEFVTIGDRRYRGNLLFRPNPDGTLTVVDEIGLEEYLFGVLPHEMSPDWPLEALKAQAVVSRSYALDRLARNGDEAYDVTDDATSQVYTGVTTESALVRRAVRETSGQTLVYAGKPLRAFFHSTCGGHTSSAADVWGGYHPRPLRGVKDRWCKGSPHYRWETVLTKAQVLAALKKGGAPVKKVEDLDDGARGKAGWLTEVRVKTEAGWRTLPANQFRLWVGARELKSVRLDRIKRVKDGWAVEGRGYGHGVGLCQWGARAQADAGRSYRQILALYFPGAQLAEDEE